MNSKWIFNNSWPINSRQLSVFKQKFIQSSLLSHYATQNNKNINKYIWTSRVNQSWDITQLIGGLMGYVSKQIQNKDRTKLKSKIQKRQIFIQYLVNNGWTLTADIERHLFDLWIEHFRGFIPKPTEVDKMKNKCQRFHLTRTVNCFEHWTWLIPNQIYATRNRLKKIYIQWIYCTVTELHSKFKTRSVHTKKN